MTFAANRQPAPAQGLLDSILGGQESLHASMSGAGSRRRSEPDHSTAPSNAGKTLDEAGRIVLHPIEYGDRELGIDDDKRSKEEPFLCYEEPFKIEDLVWQAARSCGCKNPQCPNLLAKEKGGAGAGKQKQQCQAAEDRAAAPADEPKGTHTSGVEIVPASAILTTLINCRLMEMGLSASDPESYSRNQDYSAVFKECVEFVANLCAASNSGAFNDLGRAVHKGKTVKVNFEDIVTCHSQECMKRALGNIMRSLGVDEMCICEETLAAGGLTETERCKALSDNRRFWSYWEAGHNNAERRRVYDWLVDIHVHTLYHTQKIRTKTLEIQAFFGYLKTFPACPEYLKSGVSETEYRKHAVSMMHNACVLFVRDLGFNLNLDQPWADKVPDNPKVFKGFNENFSTLENEIATYLGHAANDAYVMMVYLYWSNLNLPRNGPGGDKTEPFHPVSRYPQITAFGDTADFFCPRLVLEHLRQGLTSGDNSAAHKQITDLVDRKNYVYTTDRVGGGRVGPKIYKSLRDAVRATQPQLRQVFNPEIPKRAIKFIDVGGATGSSNKEERVDRQCRIAVMTMVRIRMPAFYNSGSYVPEQGVAPEEWQVTRRAVWQDAYEKAFLTIKSPKHIIPPTADFDRSPQLYGQTGFWRNPAILPETGKPLDRGDIVIAPAPIPIFVLNNRTRAKAEAMRVEMSFTPLGGRKRAVQDIHWSICRALVAQYEADPRPHEALGLGTRLPIDLIADEPAVKKETERIVVEARISQRVDFHALQRLWPTFPPPDAEIVALYGADEDRELLASLDLACEKLKDLLAHEFPAKDDTDGHVLLESCIEILELAFHRMDTDWRTLHGDTVDPWFNPPSQFRTIVFSYAKAEEKIKHPLKHVHKPLLDMMRMAKAPRTDATAVDPSSPIGKHLQEASKARLLHQISRRITDMHRSTPKHNSPSLLLEVQRATTRFNHVVRVRPSNPKKPSAASSAAAEDLAEMFEDSTLSVDEHDDDDGSPEEPPESPRGDNSGALAHGEVAVAQLMLQKLPELLKQHADEQFALKLRSGIYGIGDRKKFDASPKANRAKAFFLFSDESAPRSSDFHQIMKANRSDDACAQLDPQQQENIAGKLFKQVLKRLGAFRPTKEQLASATSEGI